MLTELVASELCDQVRNRFLPVGHVVPGEPPRGDEPVGGRWWIRDCHAGVNGGQLVLFLDGAGWAWAEKSVGVVASWRVRQYVYFAGIGTVVASVDAGFDPSARRLVLQVRPDAVPQAFSAVTNQTKAQGNLPAGILTALTFGILGNVVDGKADSNAQEALSTAFQRQLSAGFALTFDLHSRQRDQVALGLMPPLRPYLDGVRWLVNERQVLHRAPGALHISGPFAPAQDAGVDVIVHKGALKFRAECARDVLAWLEPVTRGVPPALPSPTHAQAGVVSVGPALRRSLAAGCPWYLMTEPDADEVIADVRVRADTSGFPLAGP